MRAQRLIIDGSNLVRPFRDSRGMKGDLEAARWTLARTLDGLAGEIASRVTLVFDGRPGGRSEAFQRQYFEVLYSPADTSADTLIERMVTAATQPSEIAVVTSDRPERRAIEAAGATGVSCEEFLEMMDDAQRRIAQRAAGTARPTRGASLGDYFPVEPRGDGP
jgi:uncharacterized protein